MGGITAPVLRVEKMRGSVCVFVSRLTRSKPGGLRSFCCMQEMWERSCITAPLHLCITAPLHHCITASLHHCTTASLHHCITASLHHCTTAPLHHCTTASLHHCITAPLHHCKDPTAKGNRLSLCSRGGGGAACHTSRTKQANSTPGHHSSALP